MAYDSNGNWINPPSIKHQKLSNDAVVKKFTALSEDEQLNLLVSIRTGEPVDEVLRWCFLRLVVRKAYKKRWGYYYQCDDWYNADTDDFILNKHDVNKQQLQWYTEVQRILDLWDIIKTQKFNQSERITVLCALKGYYLRAKDLETIAMFKYKLGVSFSGGRKKNNYKEEYIPSQFAIRAERFLWSCDYDLNKTFQAMFQVDAEKYDEYLRGERTARNARGLKPSVAKAISLYANLLRHFIARQAGECVNYESGYVLDEDANFSQLDYKDVTPIHPVLDDCIAYYSKLRALAVKVRTGAYKQSNYDIRELLKSVYGTRFVLPSTANKPKKSAYKQDSHIKRTKQ